MIKVLVEYHIEAIREHMKSLCDSSRVELIHEIMKGYCMHCGSELRLHFCYCQYDE